MELQPACRHFISSCSDVRRLSTQHVTVNQSTTEFTVRHASLPQYTKLAKIIIPKQHQIINHQHSQQK